MLAPVDVKVVPIPSEPVNRPSCGAAVVPPSYTVTKSYPLSTRMAVILTEIVELALNVQRQLALLA